MKEKAFTLIEVMVVMAIISILASMMMPPVWRYWESQEIATTRERMRDLKIAMVGDRSLVQNGVRTHYGFVGDFGELPFDNRSSCAFKFLNSNADMAGSRYNPTNWSGRYLSSSADANNYAVDAWGNPIKCVINYDTDFKNNRFISVIMRSSSPSGEILEEVITDIDVVPTDRISGNVNAFAQYSGGLIINIKPEKAGSFNDIGDNMCKPIYSFSSYTTLLPYKLPIGRIHIDLTVAKHTDCSSTKTSVTNFYYLVQDNLKVIKMPDLNIQ